MKHDMQDSSKANHLLASLEITQLLLNWGTWRDSGEFDKLRSCYTEDTTMVTSWFDGPASVFVDRSVEMRKHQPKDRGAMHFIGDWRIQRRVPVYDKDFLQLVVPGEILVLDVVRLAQQPTGFRHMAYVQSAGGMTISGSIPAPNSDEEKALYRSGQDWLKN